MLKKFFKHVWKEQKGITGLETAIILIAFVVVASVFAYTALSAGLFSTQKSQEAVYSGLEEAQSSINVKGGVIAEGLCELDDANGAWVAGSNITASNDTTNKVEGTGSVKALAGADISAAQDLATKTLTATRDLSSNNTIYFWVRSSAAITGDATEYLTLTIVDSTGNSSSASTVTGALTANTWKKATWDISGLGSTLRDAVTAVKIGIAGTSPTITSGDSVWVDIVETEPVLSTSAPMKAYADEAVFYVTNALGGEPVDFTITTDADADGLISDESTLSNKVVISYSDQYQTVTDLAWTKVAVGNDDGDNLLESNEKFQLTVDLSYINNNAGADTQKIGVYHPFTIEVKPIGGAALAIERTMPSKVTAINNLN